MTLATLSLAAWQNLRASECLGQRRGKSVKSASPAGNEDVRHDLNVLIRQDGGHIDQQSARRTDGFVLGLETFRPGYALSPDDVGLSKTSLLSKLSFAASFLGPSISVVFLDQDIDLGGGETLLHIGFTCGGFGLDPLILGSPLLLEGFNFLVRNFALSQDLNQRIRVV